MLRVFLPQRIFMLRDTTEQTLDASQHVLSPCSRSFIAPPIWVLTEQRALSCLCKLESLFKFGSKYPCCSNRRREKIKISWFPDKFNQLIP